MAVLGLLRVWSVELASLEEEQEHSFLLVGLNAKAASGVCRLQPWELLLLHPMS